MPQTSLLYEGNARSELVTNNNTWLKHLNRIKADINVYLADCSIPEIKQYSKTDIRPYKNYWTTNLFYDSNTTWE